MTIDARKRKQYFKNLNGLNDVYVWKEAKNKFSVGINGTSHHTGSLTKNQAQIEVTGLVFAKK